MYRILYVDDEPSLLEIGKIFLERSGELSVDTVFSTPDAFTLLNSKNFDAIVSDYQMPDMDGIEFLKKVRSSGNSIPFILFTGRGREEVVIQALNEGADSYIQKGGDPTSQFAELEHKIRQAIKKQRAEIALSDSEQRLADIINFLPDATLAIDTKGKVIAWNSAIEEMTGVASTVMLGKGNFEYALPFYGKRRPLLLDLIFEPDPKIAEYYTNILRNGNTLSAETNLPHPKGHQIWVLTKVSPLYNRQGDIIGAIEAIRDVTDRKKANDELRAANERLCASEEELRSQYDELAQSERQIRESEERYRNVVEDQTEFISRFLPDGTHVFVNEAYCRYFGLERDKILGHKFRPKIPVEDKERVRQFFTSLTPNHPVSEIRHRIIMSDGKVRWQRWSDRAIFDPAGTVLEYQSVGRDIDDIKKAEESLSESEEKFRCIFDTINDGIQIHEFLSDGTLGKFIEINEVACKMVQYTREELLQRAPPDITTAYHSRPLIQILNELSTSGHAIFETEHRRKDGTIVPVEINVHVSYLQGKRVAISVVRDITERKRTDDELHQKNLNLSVINELEREFAELPSGKRVEELAEKKLLELSGAVVAVFLLYDPVERMLKPTVFDYAPGIRERLPGALKKLIQILGKDPKDIKIPVSEKMFLDMNSSIIGIKKTITELTYGQVRPFVSMSLHKLSGIDRFIHVAHILDGELYGVSVIGLRIDRPDTSHDLLESFAHIVAVSLRRQQAEETLKESERKFRALVDQSLDGIIIVDFKGRILFSNKSAKKFYGYDKDILGGVNVLDIVAPECRIPAVKDFERVAAGEDGYLVSYRILNKENKEMWIECIGKKISFEGKPALLLAIRDITDRKKTDEELFKSRQMLQLVLDTIPQRVFWKGLNSVYLGCNKPLAIDCGYSDPGELVGKTDYETASAETADLYRADDQQVMKTGQPKLNYEEMQIKPDGTHAWLRTVKVPLRDKEDQIIGVLGTYEDITERKYAEEALRQANRKLNLLSGVTRHDIKNQLMALQGYLEISKETLGDAVRTAEFIEKENTIARTISRQISFTKDYEDLGVKAPVWQKVSVLVPESSPDSL